MFESPVPNRACHVPGKLLGADGHSLPVALQRPRLLECRGGGYRMGARGGQVELPEEMGLGWT